MVQVLGDGGIVYKGHKKADDENHYKKIKGPLENKKQEFHTVSFC